MFEMENRPSFETCDDFRSSPPSKLPTALRSPACSASASALVAAVCARSTSTMFESKESAVRTRTATRVGSRLCSWLGSGAVALGALEGADMSFGSAFLVPSPAKRVPDNASATVAESRNGPVAFKVYIRWLEKDDCWLKGHCLSFAQSGTVPQPIFRM